jgi:hypothetical protein
MSKGTTAVGCIMEDPRMLLEVAATKRNGNRN